MSLWDLFTPLFGFISFATFYFNWFFISDSVGFFLRISSLTGGLIVDKFLSICNLTVETVTLANSFFQIIYEDSQIFVKDATEKFTFALALLKQCYLLLEKGFQTGWTFIRHIFNFIFGAVEIVANFFSFLQLTVITSKQMLNFAGSSIWNLILSVPGMITSNITAIYDLFSITSLEIANFLHKFNESVASSFGKFYQFLFNFPLDSIYGLIIGGVLLTVIFIKLKDISIMIFSALVKLYQCTTSLLIYLWTGRFLDQKEKRNVVECDERLCVICQYLMKEIIIFPCKHLCLCWDCSVQLTKTRNTCPICRTHITETLKVYV